MKWTMKFLPVVGFWFWVLSANAAFAERVIDLNECLSLTLGYSRDILIAEEGKVSSYGRYIEERSAALPNLKAEAQVARSRDELLVVNGLATEANEYSADLRLTQAIFTWGQVRAAVKAAEHDRESAEYQIREARQLALREAATRFFDLLLAVELEQVARDNLAQKRRYLDETERKHQMEVATDYDVLAARVELTNAQPDVTQAENNIRLAKDRLRYLMGLEEGFEVTGILQCKLVSPAALETVLERAKANRPEVAYYESRVGVFNELVKVARAGDKPRLDFKGNVGWSSGDDFLDETSSGEHWSAGLFFSFPFFDGYLTKGRVIQAKSKLAVTEFEMRRLLDQIALEAREAINLVVEAIEIARGLEAATTQAERLLKMAEAGYRHGVKTKLEVDDAEINVTQARNNLARARRDYLAAHVRLLWIMGEDLQPALSKTYSVESGYCPSSF